MSGAVSVYLAVFTVMFVVSLVSDMWSSKKRHGIPSVKASLFWTGIWILVSIAFAGVTWQLLGYEKGLGFFVGWMMEKTLAIDNLFAFMAVFASFGLIGRNSVFQHRILHWGILGAIGIRGILLAFIGLLLALEGVGHTVVMCMLAGAVFFMAFLMIKDAFGSDDEEEVDYSNHWSVRLTQRVFPVHGEIDSGKFFVKKEHKGAHRWHATPLFLCLVCIEIVDVGFAFDSMPAIAAVVRDPVIMWTATLMAVAGLRALYFALLGASNVLCHLDKAVAGLLVYIGLKVTADAFHLLHVGHIENLAIISAFLGAGIVASLLWPDKKEKDELVEVQAHKEETATSTTEVAQTTEVASAQSV
jgi:tellurite resistance protein TerC